MEAPTICFVVVTANKVVCKSVSVSIAASPFTASMQVIMKNDYMQVVGPLLSSRVLFMILPSQSNMNGIPVLILPPDAVADSSQ